ALDVDKVFGYISDWYNSLDFGQIGSVAGNTILGIGAGIVAGFTGALIVLILTIYFAASTPNLKVAVAQLVPASKRARFVDLADQITASVGYYVMGQVTLGVING
ncbi:AI-2E family transporter, partial [Microbacterium lacticum]